jgi:hypothetical protein
MLPNPLDIGAASLAAMIVGRMPIFAPVRAQNPALYDAIIGAAAATAMYATQHLQHEAEPEPEHVMPGASNGQGYPQWIGYRAP